MEGCDSPGLPTSDYFLCVREINFYLLKVSIIDFPSLTAEPDFM